MTATYGSAMHTEWMKPFKQSTYSFDALYEKDEWGVTQYERLFPLEYRSKAWEWHFGFMRSLLSFWHFVKERVIEVYAIELPLRSKKYQYAGTLDFVCRMQFNGKEVLAIIDLKSNMFSQLEGKTKTFYPDHELQLELQKQLWIENFGSDEPIFLFNFAPNAWRGDEPTYTLKNQTKSKFGKPVKVGRKMVPLWELKALEALAEPINIPPTTITQFSGEFSIKNFDYSQHIHKITL
jgi:hypothetical protein